MLEVIGRWLCGADSPEMEEAGPRREAPEMAPPEAARKYRFSKRVLDKFRDHVGRYRAETGGLLGSRTDEGLIDLCYFDEHSRNTSGSFYYDVETMSAVFRRWKKKGFVTNGIFHSHPRGFIRPSYHDVSTALLHLRFFKLDYFYMPIFQPDRRGFYTLYFYVVTMEEDRVKAELAYVVQADAEGYFYPAFRPFSETFEIAELDAYRARVDGTGRGERPAKEDRPAAVPSGEERPGEAPSQSAVPPAAASEAAVPAAPPAGTGKAAEAGTQFKKVEALYPEAALDKVIICVGTGGARSFLENMARSGFRNYILIDRDVVSASNVATQGVFLSEVGRKKVDVIRDRILNINPRARVLAVDRFLDDGMSDAQFRRLMDAFPGRKPTDYLILGCTDNFEAQKRSSFLALKYGTPYLAAMMYEGGAACELMFFYPGLTECCPRCMLRDRFEKYEKGFVNDVDSSACPIFATERMNATKGMIALMILCYQAGEGYPYNDLLYEIRERTFVWIRLHPHLAETRLGIGLFDRVLAGNAARFSFMDEILWIPQHPDTDKNGGEACRLCGGRGDLRTFMKEWADRDTRKISATGDPGRSDRTTA